MNLRPGKQSYLATWRKLIVEDQELTRAAAHAALVLAAYSDRRGICWPSIDTIAAGMKCSVRTAHRGIGELETRAYLQRSPGRPGRATRYKLLLGAL